MSIVLVGSTSGSITLQEPAVAGTTVLTLPAVTGTVITTGSPQSQSVIQVVQGSLAGNVATTSNSFVTTGLTASITPLSATSKVLILVQLSNNRQSGSGIGTCFTIYKNSTNLAPTGASALLTNLANLYSASAGELQGSANMSFLDSPATTSSTAYTVYFGTSSGTSNINWNGQTSYIQLLEIAG